MDGELGSFAGPQSNILVDWDQLDGHGFFSRGRNKLNFWKSTISLNPLTRIAKISKARFDFCGTFYSTNFLSRFNRASIT